MKIKTGKQKQGNKNREIKTGKQKHENKNMKTNFFI
jgi:hypothetical protein